MIPNKTLRCFFWCLLPLPLPCSICTMSTMTRDIPSGWRASSQIHRSQQDGCCLELASLFISTGIFQRAEALLAPVLSPNQAARAGAIGSPGPPSLVSAPQSDRRPSLFRKDAAFLSINRARRRMIWISVPETLVILGYVSTTHPMSEARCTVRPLDASHHFSHETSGTSSHELSSRRTIIVRRTLPGGRLLVPSSHARCSI